MLATIKMWCSSAQATALAQINGEMERLVRECPQQYLWGYGRYKQPRGDAPQPGDAA